MTVATTYSIFYSSRVVIISRLMITPQKQSILGIGQPSVQFHFGIDHVVSSGKFFHIHFSLSNHKCIYAVTHLAL